MSNTQMLSDRFGRTVNYLRLSVTDRCDFRCTYCMSEDMSFLPRKEILTLEEMLHIAKTFVDLGTKKIRITGGEPLIRNNILELLEELGRLKDNNDGLEELCLTTNGSHLKKYAEALKHAGVDRINVSLDSLNPSRFKQLTRTGDLDRVLDGIDEALKQGFRRIKINSVILKNQNMNESCELVEYALSRKMDISFIEEMPLGDIQSHSRNDEFVSSEELRDLLSRDFRISPSKENTLGPSRYWKAAGYSSRIGFISPHSHNFCSSCNRVRLTASGRLLLCLGNEHSVDLRQLLRQVPQTQLNATLQRTIIESMGIKPEKHEFDLNEQPQVLRFMNATGG